MTQQYDGTEQKLTDVPTSYRQTLRSYLIASSDTHQVVVEGCIESNVASLLALSNPRGSERC